MGGRSRSHRWFRSVGESVTGRCIYSILSLVDTLLYSLYLLTLYGRSDITDARPYVAHNLLHNHLILHHYAYIALEYNRVQCKA
jgi:hypothetical protein